MGWESFDVFRFDLGLLLQGQMRIAKLKSAYNSQPPIFVPSTHCGHTFQLYTVVCTLPITFSNFS